jgi:hypothetical protein
MMYYDSPGIMILLRGIQIAIQNTSLHSLFLAASGGRREEKG